MKTFMGLTVSSIVMLTCWTGVGQGQADVVHDKRGVIAQLPRGAIKHGKDLPLFMKDAIKELARVSPEKLRVEALYAGVIIITDMDQYLDFIGATSPKQRKVIKRHYLAFTINRQWPIYINGQSELYETALETEDTSSQNPYVYEFVALLWHEMVHMRGQADEAIAVREEIKILENLYGRGLVKLECVNARRAKLAQILKGEISRGPIQVMTSRRKLQL